MRNIYTYWNKVKYKKSPDGCSPEILWMRVKLDRVLQTKEIAEWQAYKIHFGLTNTMQSLCHKFDLNFGGVLGNDSLLQSEDKHKYLVSSLMEEAIASSQMEGASTTRKVAKEMLRKGLKPKDKAQQMILNNYNTIRYISEHKQDMLTEEALLHIHSLMTEDTLDNPQDCGRFRDNDNVAVVDDTQNEVVHTPPSYTEIPSFVRIFCNYFNTNESGPFVHPIIKGIILHFMIAYMHPFVDGNGRTARAIFYWYMLQVELNWSYGTQQNIGMRILEKLLVCVPPVSEQIEIMKYVDMSMIPIERAIKCAISQISLLQERKQFIINEVVTGKVKVC